MGLLPAYGYYNLYYPPLTAIVFYPLIWLIDYTNAFYSGSSIVTGLAANSVLGQTSFTASGAAVTQSGIGDLYGAGYCNGMILAMDGTKNRVLVYSGALVNGMNAWRVLGQSAFNTTTTGIRH
jgi:hypothetical protein